MILCSLERMSSAQKQHYVPKFILRQFLTDEKKEQVTVFDKVRDKTFATSIANIMAERRYNDFTFENYSFSFEGVACKIEDMVLSTYRRVLAERQLNGSMKEKVDLAILIAFQLLRTTSSRNAMLDLEATLRHRVEAAGGTMDSLGLPPLTDELLKQITLTDLKEEVGEFASIISKYDFLLMEPSENRSFYLGDNPVCRSNDEDHGQYGTLGIACKGIQIYLPLSSNLMVAAWCPSVAEKVRWSVNSGFSVIREGLLDQVLNGRLSASEMKTRIEYVRQIPHRILVAKDSGSPLASEDANMDFHNSRQVAEAYRYVVCKKADFSLAKRFNKEFPGRRRFFGAA